MWTINFTDEYLEWFTSLSIDCKEAVLSKVLLLQEFGPLLPRPYADVLHGSKYTNLKELRVQSGVHVMRIAYYFDAERQALLLAGGDKKGKQQKAFYESFIRTAEKLIEKYKKEGNLQ